MIRMKAKFKLLSVKDIDLSGIPNKIRNELVAELKEATPVDTGYARGQWRVEGDKIINDADYIQNLNDGSSNQAPEFFIERIFLNKPGVKITGGIVKPR
jgi:hypothetical protein